MAMLSDSHTQLPLLSDSYTQLPLLSDSHTQLLQDISLWWGVGEQTCLHSISTVWECHVDTVSHPWTLVCIIYCYVLLHKVNRNLKMWYLSTWKSRYWHCWLLFQGSTISWRGMAAILSSQLQHFSHSSSTQWSSDCHCGRWSWAHSWQQYLI